jgi:hypothetical protein
MAANPEILAKLQAQLKELASLKAELDQLTRDLSAGPPAELVALRQEIEQLKAEQEKLTAQEAALPPKYRVPPPYEPGFGDRHLFWNQPLFPPPNEEEATKGRVRWLPPEEHICHPLPFEVPQQGGKNPPVLARITCRWGKS